MGKAAVDITFIFRQANRAGIASFRLSWAGWSANYYNRLRSAARRHGVDINGPFVWVARRPEDAGDPKGITYINPENGAGAAFVQILDQIGVEWDWDGSDYCGIAIPHDPASYRWRHLASRSAHKRADLIARFGAIEEDGEGGWRPPQ